MREQGRPKSRFAESFGKIGDALLNLFRGDFPVFLLFLAITFFFWWSQTMSQSYDSTLNIPIRVTDVPDEVRVTMPPVKYVTVSLSGKGSALHKSIRRGGRNVLNVSSEAFNSAQGHASLSTLRLRDSITSLLPASVSIKSISPDSLVYLYSLQRSIVLPVEFDGIIR